ncbi:MAG TPA: DinB family protein [Sporichthya sp.]|nr:DinB family protein [Sporichthya sp.]
MAERDDILDLLAKHRHFLRHTAGGLTDEQARTRSTISELTVGGLIKHVTRVEQRWANFMEEGTSAFVLDGDAYAAHAASFVMATSDTLGGLLADYEAVAARTDKLVAELDLDVDYGLPVTPWWPEGMRWSVRRAALHIVAETAQHAGHADIVREAIDGQKTMG